MKTLFSFCLLAMLSGCMSEERKSGTNSPIPYGTDMFMWTDPLTGCSYIHNHAGITPRLDMNGKPICLHK